MIIPSKQRTISILFLLFLDILILFSSLLFATYLRYEFQIPHEQALLLTAYFPYFIGICLAVNFLFSSYGSNYQHAGFYDASKQLLSSFSAGCLLLLLKYTSVSSFPGSIIVMAMIISSVLMVGVRFNSRIIRAAQALRERDSRAKVLLIGSGEASSTLIRHLRGESGLKRRPVAVIASEAEFWGTHLNGLPIIGGLDIVPQVIDKYHIDEVIIALPSIAMEEKRDLFRICTKLSVPLKNFPGVININDTRTKPILETISFEDLLGRSAVRMEKDWVAGYTKDKVVMVTGGAGSIGSEICRQILEFDCKQLIIADFSENGLYEIENELMDSFGQERFEVCLCSIRDKSRLWELFDKYRPEVVFHAAAHKHVPMMEKNPLEAAKNNIFGTKNLIDQCIQFKIKKFILISSDKAVNPANIMGATKRICELLVQVHNGVGGVTMSAVRFGNVLGSNGSVIPLFKKQILEGKSVTVTHKDMVRYFMTIPEAVQLVLQASALAKGGEIFVLDMGSPVKIYDLACQLIRQAGLQPEKDIEIQFTGLRPGEKLFEELNLDNERVTKTAHNMIFICHPSETSKEKLDETLAKLQQYIIQHDADAVLECIFTLIPSKYRYIAPAMKTEKISVKVAEYPSAAQTN